MANTTTDRQVQVDWEGLANDVGVTCARRLVSLRTAAEQMGIPVSGLSKLTHGNGKLSADALARLVVWLYPRAALPWWITSKDEGERA